MGLFRKTLLGTAVAVITSVGSAHAVPVLSYQIFDGSTSIGSGSTLNGFISLSGSDSRFSIVNGTASSAPSMDVPDFSTNVFSLQSRASTGTDTLTIQVTTTGLTGYMGGNVANTFTLNSLNGGPFTSGTISNYFDNSNTAYGTGTLLATQTYTGIGSFSNTVTGNTSPSATFSETTIYVLNYGAGGTSSVSASSQLNDVPEPASMALLGAGLVGVGVLRRRRAK